MTEIVLVSVDGPVAVVTLNRPDARNALNRELRKELPTVLRGLDERDDIAAIVLTGADPAFCAGLDLKELAAGGDARRGPAQQRSRRQEQPSRRRGRRSDARRRQQHEVRSRIWTRR